MAAHSPTRIALAAVIVALLSPPGPADAQMPAAGSLPTPFVTPQRDVDVTYLLAGPPAAPGGLPGAMTQRMRWSVALWSQRLDPAGNAYMITDYRARRMLVVDPRRRSATMLPLPGGGAQGAGGVQAPGLRATGHYQRLGGDTVAGTPCTEWRTLDDGGAESTICLTDDGVLLRARHGQQILLLASSVRYGPQDPSLFSAPSGSRIEPAPSQ